MSRALFLLLGFILMSCKSDAHPQKEIKGDAIHGQLAEVGSDSGPDKVEGEKIPARETASKPDVVLTLPPNEKRKVKDGLKNTRTSPERSNPSTEPEKKQSSVIVGQPVDNPEESHTEGQNVPGEKDDEDPVKEVLPINKSNKEKPHNLDQGVDHSTFNGLLARYVNSSGRVDYAGLNENYTDFKSYLTWLGKKTPDDTWDRKKAMAYWINAYNAYTLDLILTHYPVASITDLDGGNPWDVKRINLAGTKFSLNQIEHEILRPQFNDARIHFAVNCAATSCPRLLNQAWTAQNIDGNLDKMTSEFINNPAYNKIQKSKVSLSKIFEWYKDDFGDLITFINRYSTVQMDKDAKIEYLEYDWSLNGK